MKAKKSFVICHLSYVLKFSFFLFLFSFFLLSSCKRSTEPLYNPKTLQLTVADVSCTEAWLKLNAQIAQKDSSDLKLQLYRNDRLIVNKPLTNADSVLYVDGLQPATTYSFSAKVLKNDKLQATSNKLPVTTMDTTSHNYTWQTFEFGGQGGSSSFYDVAIIDENDIWAVGEIYTADDKYNAAHWNGEKWELRKIANDSYPRRVVYAFGKNDVWFDGTIKWDGTVHMKNFPLLPNGDGWYENAMWGTSNDDFYLVGDYGMIAHYDGWQWQRIESGTDLDIHDIWGDTNPFTGKTEILAVASVFEYNEQGKLLLKIKNKNVSYVDTTGLPDALQTIWFKSGKIYYLAGDGLYLKKLNANSFEKWFKINDLPKLYKNAIRGTYINNIFVVGAYGLISHFNGITWHNYNPKEFPLIYGSYYSMDLKNNIVVAVGFKDEAGYILMGFKQ